MNNESQSARFGSGKSVLDALARHGLGVRADTLQMPFTAERVWRALQG